MSLATYVESGSSLFLGKLTARQRQALTTAVDTAAHAVAFIAILPGVLPGIVYPYWWFAALTFYETAVPPLFGVDATLSVLVGAAAAYLVARKGWKYLLVLGAFLLATYLSSNAAGWWLLGAYVLVCYAALAIFATEVRITSFAFLGMLAVFVLFVWRQDHTPLLLIAKTVEFLVNYFLIRLTVSIAILNYKQLAKIDAKYYLRIALETVRLWLPVLVLAGFGIFLNKLLFDYLTARAYEGGVIVTRPAASEPVTPDLYWDMKFTIDSRFDGLDTATEDFRQQMLAQLEALPTVLPQAAVAEFDQATPAPPLIRGSPCPSGGVKGILLGGPCRMIVSAVNASYEEYRNDKRAQLYAKMERIALDQQRDGTARVEEAHRELREFTAAARVQTRALLLYGFNAFLGISFVLNLVFFFVLVKSFLLVLARVAYSQDYRATFTIEPEADGARRSRNLPIANNPSANLVLRKSRADPFYLVNNHKWNGTSGSIKFPQPFSCYFTRVANKAYVMNQVNLNKGQEAASSVTLSVVPPYKIVAVQLRRSQRMVFKFEDFAGMTSRVRIESVFSPNISLFSLGRRFFYVTATGPGTVLLMGEGDIRSGAQSRNKPIAAERVLAFDATERFKLDSIRTYANVYLNRAYVIPQGSLTVTDSRDIPQAGIFKQVWKLVKFLVLPW